MDEGGQEPLEVEITALAAGGDGVGRLADGRVVFVPGSAPGDRLRVRLVEERRRFARARIQRVIAPGPGRTEPRCAHFGRCGGCSWQHLDSAAQLEAKARIVSDALERIGGLALPGAVVVEPSPTAYGYRSRARLHAEAGRVGYRAARSHALVAVGECPVLVPALEQRLAALARERPARGEWEIAASGERTRAVRLGGRGGGRLEIRVGEDRLSVSSGVFFQGNLALAARVSEVAAAAAGEGRLAFELFAGAGLLSLPLARRFERLVCVESHARAAADLAHNLRRAALSGAEVVVEPVERFLARDLDVPDVVVLDPPRIGLATGAVEALAGLGAARLVYVSCDPATLARDLRALAARGYALREVRAFDFFPQTPHVEVLARLER